MSSSAQPKPQLPAAATRVRSAVTTAGAASMVKPARAQDRNNPSRLMGREAVKPTLLALYIQPKTVMAAMPEKRKVVTMLP